jgi:hypothetical protein
MTTRTSPPNGAPLRADLRTSAQGGGRFYGAQFKLRANNG